jgi:hypothetical protein
MMDTKDTINTVKDLLMEKTCNKCIHYYENSSVMFCQHHWNCATVMVIMNPFEHTCFNWMKKVY